MFQVSVWECVFLFFKIRKTKKKNPCNNLSLTGLGSYMSHKCVYEHLSKIILFVCFYDCMTV